jgi:hypothetical protein
VQISGSTFCHLRCLRYLFAASLLPVGQPVARQLAAVQTRLAYTAALSEHLSGLKSLKNYTGSGVLCSLKESMTEGRPTPIRSERYKHGALAGACGLLLSICLGLSLASAAELQMSEQQPSVPFDISLWANSSDAADRCRAATHAGTTPEILALLADDGDPAVRGAVAVRPALPGDLIVQLAADGDISVRLIVAARADLPESVATRLANDKSRKVRLAVAKNPSTPNTLSLIIWARDGTVSDRRRVAHTGDLPLEVFLVLAGDKDVEIRRICPLRGDAPAEFLAVAGKDEDVWVRRYVAKHKRTQAAVLGQLASDVDRDVCKYVAGNHNTHSNVLAEMSQCEDEFVLRRLAGNPNLPTENYVDLGRRGFAEGLAGQAWRTKDPYWMARFAEEKELRSHVAMNPYATSSVLATLAKDDYYMVRRYVSRNANTSDDTLRELAKDKDHRVRAELARHPNMPTQLMDLLSRDPHWRVRYELARKGVVPIPILERLEKDSNPSVASDARLSLKLRRTAKALAERSGKEISGGIVKVSRSSKLWIEIRGDSGQHIVVIPRKISVEGSDGEARVSNQAMIERAKAIKPGQRVTFLRPSTKCDCLCFDGFRIMGSDMP